MTDYNDLIERLTQFGEQGFPIALQSADAINELVAERDDMHDALTVAYLAGAKKWKARAEKAEADLGNLLAIMLGDGGHYQQECGTDSALKEATELWYAYISLADNLKTDLAVAQAALRHADTCDWMWKLHHAPAIAAARAEGGE